MIESSLRSTLIMPFPALSWRICFQSDGDATFSPLLSRSVPVPAAYTRPHCHSDRLHIFFKATQQYATSNTEMAKRLTERKFSFGPKRRSRDQHYSCGGTASAMPLIRIRKRKRSKAKGAPLSQQNQQALKDAEQKGVPSQKPTDMARLGAISACPLQACGLL